MNYNYANFNTSIHQKQNKRTDDPPRRVPTWTTRSRVFYTLQTKYQNAMLYEPQSRVQDAHGYLLPRKGLPHSLWSLHQLEKGWWWWSASEALIERLNLLKRSFCRVEGSGGPWSGGVPWCMHRTHHSKKSLADSDQCITQPAAGSFLQWLESTQRHKARQQTREWEILEHSSLEEIDVLINSHPLQVQGSVKKETGKL